MRVGAHPRSRGENEGSACGPDLLEGSSPLTRGKRDHGTVLAAAHGLIPAHAGKTTGRARPAGPMRAHPRSRGENGLWNATAIGFVGSSPLTRGKRRSGEPLRRGRGLIPAHAGKTRGSSGRSGQPGAHPRSRGENLGGSVDVIEPLGSSPLTRGKRHVLYPPTFGRAHPRSRGENGLATLARALSCGSSPLTRGKH